MLTGSLKQLAYFSRCVNPVNTTTFRLANGNAMLKKPASRIAVDSRILPRHPCWINRLGVMASPLHISHLRREQRNNFPNHQHLCSERARFLSACSGASDALTMFGGLTGKKSPMSPTTSPTALKACALAGELGWRCAQHVTAVASPWDVACVLDVVLKNHHPSH